MRFFKVSYAEYRSLKGESPMRRSNNIVGIPNNQRTEVLLSSVVEEYLRDSERRGLSEYTVKHDKENFMAIMKTLSGNTPIASLTTEQIESQVFDHMRQRHLAPRTINGRIKSLRKLMKYAVNHGYAPFNVAMSVQRMVEPQEGLPSLSTEQIDALLNQCDLKKFTGFRDYTLMSVLLDTGLRLRELTSLTVRQVDLRNHCIREVLGKNRKVEDVAVSVEVCNVLEQYLIERDSAKVDTDILFVTVDGGPLNRNSIQKIIKKYGNEVGITDVRVSPHTFRHTLAKHWLLNKGDIFSLQKTLRHSDIGMVKRYVHFWDHELVARHEEFSPMAKRKLNSSISKGKTKER